MYLLYKKKKKKEKREEKKKKRKIVFEENKIKSLKFQFEGVMGSVRRIAGNLSSYISQLNNCWQYSLELVFSYSFVSIALSLSLITSNKSPLDVSFAIMIVEK